jgi:predicted protein tyrosine phosphatase
MGKAVRMYFLCVQNRCRSQIAEAFARHYGGDKVVPDPVPKDASEGDIDEFRRTRDLIQAEVIALLQEEQVISSP